MKVVRQWRQDFIEGFQSLNVPMKVVSVVIGVPLIGLALLAGVDALLWMVEVVLDALIAALKKI
jgi:hypothetical protein